MGIIVILLIIVGIPGIIIGIRDSMLRDPNHPRYGDKEAEKENVGFGCMLMVIIFIFFMYFVYLVGMYLM